MIARPCGPTRKAAKVHAACSFLVVLMTASAWSIGLCNSSVIAVQRLLLCILNDRALSLMNFFCAFCALLWQGKTVSLHDRPALWTNKKSSEGACGLLVFGGL